MTKSSSPTNDVTHKKPRLKSIAGHMSYMLCRTIVSFWIVLNMPYAPLLKPEDIVLNVVLNTLWLLMISYLLFPLLKWLICKARKLRTGETTAQEDKPTKKYLRSTKCFSGLLAILFSSIFWNSHYA